MISRRMLGTALMAAVLAIGGGPIAAASAKPASKHAKKHAKRARAAQTDQTTSSSGSTSVSDPGSTDVSPSDHCPGM
jgi:hypothetical protein